MHYNLLVVFHAQVSVHIYILFRTLQMQHEFRKRFQYTFSSQRIHVALTQMKK